MRLYDWIRKSATVGLFASVLGVGSDALRSQVPGLPINYWDAPSECATCNPSRGAFRDGLHFVDGSLVELLMDCDANFSKETNVDKGFPYTIANGAYNIDVYEETASECGYNVSNPSRNKGDARIDGLVAYPRNLAFTQFGESFQQRLDTFTHYLRMPNPNLLDWEPGNREVDLLGGGYDIVRSDVASLKQANGLANLSVTQVYCNYPFKALLGDPFVTEIPNPAQTFFYLVRPRTFSEKGNYGDINGVPRPNPLNDCL